MEYQKITNLLDSEVALNTSNKPTKFRTRNWVEINDDIREHTLLISKLDLKLPC